MRNIKYIFLVLFTGVLFSSCEKFLEKEPYENLSKDGAISSINDAEVAVFGAYSGMQSANYYGRNFVVTPEVAADNVKVAPENSGRFLGEYQYSIIPTSGNPTNLWNLSYAIIDRVNNAIEKIPGLTDGTSAERNAILGEAYAVRGLVYFDLVRYFAQPYNLSDNSIAANANGVGGHLGVPYVTVSEIGTPARNTVAEVYAGIISDLKEAETLMSGAGSTSGRLSAMGAKALLAKVYLYMEDWGNAENYASEVINSGYYSLLSNADYISSWGQEFSTESIFSIGMSVIDYPSTDALGYIYLESGYGDLIATQDLMDLFVDGDVRHFNSDNTDEDGVSGLFKDVGGVVYINKFPGRDNTDGLDNTPVLRLSEMYLIRAEARASSGNASGAQADLNLIRKRCNPGAEDVIVAGDALIDEIIHERRLELAFEGNRLWDLTRRKKSIQRTDCTLSNCTTSYPNVLFAYPIPQREIDANENMVQNKGYN